jgi:ubiquinone biosynthesis protein COQ4
MKSFKQKTILFMDILLLIFGLLKVAMNPRDISPIFRGRTFRDHKSMKLALASLKSKPEVAELFRTRYLSAKPYDLSELVQLPGGSLGKVYAEHMLKNKLDIVFYPPLEDKVDDDIAYMRKRARQTHDIHHVVLGFPAEDIGEMSISAFYLAQNQIPLSGLLIGCGFFNAVIKQPHRIDELMNAIIKGWAMGKQAKDVLGVKWEEYFSTQLDIVRRELNICLTEQNQKEPAGELMPQL